MHAQGPANQRHDLPTWLSHTPPPLASPPFARLLPLAPLLITLACSPAEAPPPAEPEPVTTTCPAPARRADNTCCPTGQAVDVDSGACAAVGPPACAEVALTKPAQCVPRWCWDLRDDADEHCATLGLRCRPVGRACTASELADGDGCPAGETPDADGTCTTAGLLATSAWATKGADPFAPPPPLPDLPADEAPRWCLVDDQARRCPADAAGCAVGEAPGKDGACLPAGVPWLCPPGFVPAPDGTATAASPPPCTPDPADCGSGVWPADLPDKGVLYVDVAAQSGGDGSATKPFSGIGPALKAASSGATIALAAGAYKEALYLAKSVTIRGRCAAKTVLLATNLLATVRVQGAGVKVAISGLALHGDGLGLFAQGGAQVTLSRVHVYQAMVAGVLSEGQGTQVTLADSLVSETGADISGQAGRGVEASAGGRLQILRTRISTQYDVGLLVAGQGSQGHVQEVLVSDTRRTQAGLVRGRGIEVNGGARLTLDRARVVGSADVGLRVAGAGTQVTSRLLAIEGSLTPPKLPHGGGIRVQKGAELTLHGAAVTAVREAGLHVGDAGSAAKVGGLRVHGTRSLPGYVVHTGHGVVVRGGGWLELVGADLVDNRRTGLVIADPGSHAWVKALRVASTRSASAGETNTAGVHASLGAQLDLEAARLFDNDGAGLAVGNAGTLAEARELVVVGSRPLEVAGLGGLGALVFQGGQLKLAQGRLSANIGGGLYVIDGSVATASDLLVDGSEASGQVREGRGILVAHDSSMEMVGVRLSGNRAQGLSVEATGSFVAARDLLVDDTRSKAADGTGGYGVVAIGGARIWLSRARLHGNRSAGLVALHKGGAVRGWGLQIDATAGDTATGNYGNAATTSQHAVIELAGSLLSGNRSGGLVSAEAGSLAVAIGTIIEDTALDATGGYNGMGAASILDAGLELNSCILRGNRVAGAFLGLGVASVVDSLVIATGMGGLVEGDGLVQFGDGIMAARSERVTVRRTLITGNHRAGLYAWRTKELTLDALVASNNLFGVVLEEAQAQHETPSALFDNAQANFNGGMKLDLPTAPAVVTP